MGSWSRITLTPLSCFPNFPRAQYIDIRTLTHELIVNQQIENSERANQIHRFTIDHCKFILNFY